MVDPSTIAWKYDPSLTSFLKTLQEEMGRDYLENTASLKKALCSFFDSSPECNTKFAFINPIGANNDGGKWLKVRWAPPGEGKSSGWRMGFVVYCNERVVRLCYMKNRAENLSTKEYRKEFRNKDKP